MIFVFLFCYACRVQHVLVVLHLPISQTAGCSGKYEYSICEVGSTYWTCAS